MRKFNRKNDQSREIFIEKDVSKNADGSCIISYGDTYAEKENFFSFRRSRKLGEKDYGRCISTIGLNNI